MLQDAQSISEFCESHRISQALFYKLKNLGTGPRTMKVGDRTLVSREAAEQWRRECEAQRAA